VIQSERKISVLFKFNKIDSSLRVTNKIGFIEPPIYSIYKISRGYYREKGVGKIIIVSINQIPLHHFE
jgi:hypothetical protein